jgi:D-alanine-D-alanine ligase
MAKLRVGLLFGGRSVEHEVSMASATSILEALDPSRYEVSLIAVDADGQWHLGSSALPPEASTRGGKVLLPAIPGTGGLVEAGDGMGPLATPLDVVFPIIHGRGGEDGSLQGLLELADLPYVGSGVLGSAVQMDKDVAKRLLAAAGLPVVPWEVVRIAKPSQLSDAGLAEIASGILARARFSLPYFVKPSNSGSSVGTSKVESADTLARALAAAARYDAKILIEEAIDARELEVAVLGNNEPVASIPGEIVMEHTFYDYEAKYIEDSTRLVIPAPLSDGQTAQIREMAIQAYQFLEGDGMARVDFLLDRKTQQLYINELNSLPGFTKESSMYPRLWEASGLSYPALLDRLIELAMERHSAKSRLETTYRGGDRPPE